MGRMDEVISLIRKLDMTSYARTQDRLDNLTKPKASLGRLEDIAKHAVEITGKDRPSFKSKIVFVMAADHGVADDGVSAYPKAVTEQMVYNFVRGGAAINVLARHAGAKVVVTDMGVAADLKMKDGVNVKKIAYGTKSMTKGPAMSHEEAVIAVKNGMDVFYEEYKKGVDLAGTGDMGIGNTTASSAITSVITGLSPEEVTGRGTGIDDAVFKHKVDVIKRAISLNKPDASDGLDVLAKVGGFEIGGIAGVILAAASKRVPVVVDGFISGAAALIACKIEPNAREYIFASHLSVEKGHRAVLNHMKLKPVLDLDLRLGEGTGAVLAMGIIEASCKILSEMATFESANVSRQSKP